MAQVVLEAGGVRLDADVVVPAGAVGVLLIAHASGSSRHSPRNQAVAGTLRERGLATVLVDLLTPEEERVDAVDGRLRFDIGLLADRLTGVMDDAPPAIAELPLGLFGASTGGAAALVAAAGRPERVRAVVSRGGRPDLAGPALTQVRAPTLLVVGQHDAMVVNLNERARQVMTAPTELRIVPGASHLFAEPGALEEVGVLAADWFTATLPIPLDD
ncbi:dienelactone hydrolase family protein [Actinophytocola sp.]|uniref:dienelactone hydrolase family protein n=1 Tax=Actinophytocola sp. TaxID=1872138 RepID=UPI003899E9C3